jgi:hypothetical protein
VRLNVEFGLLGLCDVFYLVFMVSCIHSSTINVIMYNEVKLNVELSFARIVSKVPWLAVAIKCKLLKSPHV